MRVTKWGKSLAIRLPAAVAEALDLVLRASGKRMLEIEKSPSAKERLARLRRFRGRLHNDFKFNRWEANGRR